MAAARGEKCNSGAVVALGSDLGDLANQVVKLATGVHRFDVARADDEVAEAFAGVSLPCKAAQDWREFGDDLRLR